MCRKKERERRGFENNARRLDSRIVGVDAVVFGPVTPGAADIIQNAAVGDGVCDEILGLDELQSKAHRDVPTNMTVLKIVNLLPTSLE